MKEWSLITATLIGLLAAGGCEKPAEHASTQPSEPDPAEYAASLAAADAFCHAWRTGDVDTARGLLDGRLIRKHPEKHIRGVLGSQGNPRHAGFELWGGKRLSDGRYRFQVRLFYAYAGQSADRMESSTDVIVLGSDDTGTWHVEQFPLLVP